MIAYLFDTSVLLHTVLPPKLFVGQESRAAKVKNRIKSYVFAQWVDNEASLIVPNFIVAETLKIVAGFFMGDEKKDIKARIQEYDNFKNGLIGLIKYRPILNEQRTGGQVNKFITYELNRHHILNLDDIFKFDYQTLPMRKNKKGDTIVLSTHDALLVSVGVELQRFFGNDNVYILTLDKRIVDVCMRWSPELPKAVLVDDDSITEQLLFPKMVPAQQVKFRT